MGSAGFFGPDSVAWRVHADPSGIVSGIRSLMVQALQPRAMAAVAQHSDFRVDFWGRLQRTSDFLFTVVYGTTSDAERVSARVRSIHSQISGIDDYTGLAYRADEPELLVWVHNATVESYLTGYRLYGRSLSAGEADRYVAEMRVLGMLMGLDESAVAQDVGDLNAYFVERAPLLAAAPSAKEGVRRLLNPDLPLALKPLWTIPALAAVASLPREYRSAFDLPWIAPLNPGVRVSTTALMSAFRLLLPPPPLVEEAMARTSPTPV